MLERRKFLARKILAEHWVFSLRRIRGFDHHFRQMLRHEFQNFRLAAPPGLHGRQLQFLAQQIPAHRGKEGKKSGRLQNAAADRVGDRHIAAANGLQQSRHAQVGIRQQFERIAEIVVHPAKDHVDALQSSQRLHVDDGVANGQIVSLHERVAEISRQEGMFEIRFVVGARSVQDDARVFVIGRGEFRQSFPQRHEEWREALHLALAEDGRQRAGKNDPILERIARARGRLRAVAQNFELPGLVAHQVRRVQVQPAALRQPDPVTRAEKAGIGPQQFRRKHAAKNRIRRAIQVRQQTVQQPRALDQPFADAVPMGAGDEQGNEIQAPGPVQAVRIAVDVVRDAILVNQAPRQIAPVAELAGLQFIEQRNKFPPVRPERPVGLHHFIGEWGVDSVVVGEAASQRVVSFDATRSCRSLHISY